MSDVGRELALAMRGVLDAIPGQPHRPIQLAKTLGLKKDLTSRVLKATRKKDPMAITHFMPGPEALRRLLSAAEKKRVPADVVERAAEAVGRFDHLIRRFAGDRNALDGIIAAWLTDARAKVELLSKQAVFKGMSTIKGAAADINLCTNIICPASNGKRLDAVIITGLLGLKRMRPGALVKFVERPIHAPDDNMVETLDGQPVESLRGLTLDQFCSAPVAEFDVRREGNVVHYVLSNEGVGCASAVDILVAVMSRSCLTRYQTMDNPRKRGPFAVVGTPVKELIIDTLLHEDAYPGSEATLVIHDTVIEGSADVNDPGRNIDRLNMLESVRFLGHGPSALRVSEFPHYVDMIRYASGKVGWDAERFRAFRCRISYPIYGSQVHTVFDAPPPPNIG